MVNRCLLAALSLGVLVCASEGASIVLKGNAIDCEIGKRHAAAVDVYVFDAAKVPEMANLLKSIESSGPLDDSESIQRFSQRFSRMVKLLKSNKPLARLKPGQDGKFEVRVPAVENLIVIGYGEPLDQPFYWDHRELAVSHKSTVDVLLDIGDYCSSSAR